MNNSDMIIEVGQEISIPSTTYTQKGIAVHESSIDKVLARKINKREGKYITLSPKYTSSPTTITNVMSFLLRKLLRGEGIYQGKILVVGLGNDNVIVDALGNEVIKNIRTGGNDYDLSAIAPKVADITGIKSFDIVKAIVEHHKPDAIIAIDTLATNHLNRLGVCYQLTTCGICPGSGVGNTQPCMDKSSLLVPVIAIGVPLIISVGSIMDSKNMPRGYAHYMLTPRDVDTLVTNCGKIIADAINSIKF